MTRVKISAFILGALIVLGVFSGIWVNKRCDELLALAGSVRTYSENGYTESALKAAGELRSCWESFHRIANIMVKSDKLSEISRINARIVPLLENESDELSAELDELTEMLAALQKGEEPVFTSVF